MVYAEREELVATRSLLRQIQAASDPLERLIRFGQWEAAVADALSPETDEITQATRTLRQCARQDDFNAAEGLALPETLRIRPPEGYAYYALHPDSYAEAARRFLRECRPPQCVVVGIRSIGTSLATVVERVLADGGSDVFSFTVRPRGHPFDRCVRLGDKLQQSVRQHSPASWFAVVDEGPGLSGSSFVATADALRRCGVPAERIVFFPSYQPDVSALVSAKARHAWPEYRLFVEPYRPPVNAADLSGGAWRDLLNLRDVPAHPQHERRKYLSDGVLWKFSGLAHLGRAKLQRAHQLAALGLSPPPIGFENGYLLTRWVEGRPATPPAAVVARYLAHLAAEFETGDAPDLEAICNMIAANTGTEIRAPEFLRDVSVVRIDARMLPHEWLRTPQGCWLKADGLDHHDDHFWPGCQDIAWDLAAGVVELGFDADHLSREYQRFRPDRTLHRRVQWYRLAYLAQRIGYCRMFAGADNGRFRRLADAYTATFERTVATLPSNSSA
jgi:hypothetical protein